MKNKRLIRPVTGRLLVGGQYGKGVGRGVLKSWLAEEDPSEFLFTSESFKNGGDCSLAKRFIVPAMETRLPSVLLDIPLDATGSLLADQNITMLYLREGTSWIEAKVITAWSCQELQSTVGDYALSTTAWREWDVGWFLALVQEAVGSKQRELEMAIAESFDLLNGLADFEFELFITKKDASS